MSVNIIETNWTWNTGLTSRSATKYIALHHAAASVASAADVDRWHKQNGWAGIGYHFYVRKNGSIYRGRPLGALGAHVSGKNDVSLGICAEGNYTTEQMSDAQKRAIAELLDYLKTNYYPNAEIVGHREIGSSDCPGKNYPLAELKNYKNILNGDDELMSKEYDDLKIKYEALKKEFDNLCESREPIYRYGTNLPDWGAKTVAKLMSKGFLEGEAPDNLNLSESMLRVLVVNDRAGLYD